jgi:hypothetical protein
MEFAALDRNRTEPKKELPRDKRDRVWIRPMTPLAACFAASQPNETEIGGGTVASQ